MTYNPISDTMLSRKERDVAETSMEEREKGLGYHQKLVLEVLKRHGKHLTPQDICEITELGRNRVKETIDSLSRRRLARILELPGSKTILVAYIDAPQIQGDPNEIKELLSTDGPISDEQAQEIAKDWEWFLSISKYFQPKTASETTSS